MAVPGPVGDVQHHVEPTGRRRARFGKGLVCRAGRAEADDGRVSGGDVEPLAGRPRHERQGYAARRPLRSSRDAAPDRLDAPKEEDGCSMRISIT